MRDVQAKSTLGAGCILEIDQHFLLVQMNYGRYQGHWILPGGMVEPGEHPHEAALRELNEETGISQAKIHSQLAVRHRVQDEQWHNVYWVFVAQLTQAFTLTEIQQRLVWPNDELQSVKFWSYTDLMNSKQVRPLTQLFIQKYNQPQLTPHYQWDLKEMTSQNDVIF